MLAFREEGVYDRRLGSSDLPVSIFVPQKLEERYAYPLLVFLHSHGEDERQWLSQMMHLSRRNYIGLALRGPHRVVGKNGRPGYGWGRDRRSVSSIEDYALAAIDDVRSRFPINSRKIHLAGFGEGASLALQLGLFVVGAVLSDRCLQRLASVVSPFPGLWTATVTGSPNAARVARLWRVTER